MRKNKIDTANIASSVGTILGAFAVGAVYVGAACVSAQIEKENDDKAAKIYDDYSLTSEYRSLLATSSFAFASDRELNRICRRYAIGYGQYDSVVKRLKVMIQSDIMKIRGCYWAERFQADWNPTL